MSKKFIQKVFCGYEIKEIDTSNFTAKVVMSDETLDRYDEIIEAEAWSKTIKQFMKHPVLLSSHRYSGDLRAQIGEWTKVYQDGSKLMGIPKYYVDEGNPEADWAWKLVEKGIAAFSVGLIPRKVETMDWDKYNKLKEEGKRVARRRYKDVELIETSQVLIPANPAALQRDMNGEDEVRKTVATFYFHNSMDQLKDLTDIEIVESDIAEKFLIKDPAQELIDELGLVGVDEHDDSVDANKNKELEEALNRGWEETENEIRARLKEPSLFSKFRYMMLKKDKPRVNAVYGQYKGKDKWGIQALRFPKGDGWTMESAKKWASEHPTKLFEELDVLDYEMEDSVFDMVEQLSTQMVLLTSEIGLLSKTSSNIMAAVETIMKEWFDKIDDKLNVKAIVPNESYLDGILEGETEKGKTSIEDQTVLKSLMSLLQSTTDTIKTHVK